MYLMAVMDWLLEVYGTASAALKIGSSGAAWAKRVMDAVDIPGRHGSFQSARFPLVAVKVFDGFEGMLLKATDDGQLKSMTFESKLKRMWMRVKRLYEIPMKRPDEICPDPGDTSPLIQEVRAMFEGREAIYIEQGAVRVRISNIRGSASQAIISAEVEEIPTPGLGVGRFRHLPGNKPLRWTINAGYLTVFSDQLWTMGYGGWSLYFHPSGC